MQYQRLKGEKTKPTQSAVIPFQCINSFPARCPEASWDIAPEKTRGYGMIAPYVISLYKNLGLQNKFLHGKKRTGRTTHAVARNADAVAGDDGMWAVEQVAAKTNGTSQIHN